MSFFNFNYDPSNPRVGDRVIVVGDDELNALTDAGGVPWFAKHRGGEFYINMVSSDRSSVTLSSPLTNSIDDYTWRPSWLAPAPKSLPTGTCVMVPEIYLNERYRNNGNWASGDMDRYRCSALYIRCATANGYFEVEGNGYSWHRDWMFIMADAQHAEPRFKEGDLVLVKGNISNSIVNGKGIIRCTSPAQPISYRIEMYGKIRVVSESRLILIERDGQHVFERNSIEAKDLVF